MGSGQVDYKVCAPLFLNRWNLKPALNFIGSRLACIDAYSFKRLLVNALRYLIKIFSSYPRILSMGN